jgi:hypothetical protein
VLLLFFFSLYNQIQKIKKNRLITKEQTKQTKKQEQKEKEQKEIMG